MKTKKIYSIICLIGLLMFSTISYGQYMVPLVRENSKCRNNGKAYDLIRTKACNDPDANDMHIGTLSPIFVYSTREADLKDEEIEKKLTSLLNDNSEKLKVDMTNQINNAEIGLTKSLTTMVNELPKDVLSTELMESIKEDLKKAIKEEMQIVKQDLKAYIDKKIQND